MSEEATREAAERERQRADAARERANEGRRSAASMDAERHAPSVWNEAVGKSAEGEAALSRQQYAKASEAFAAALALYHQAQAQARESARRQREEAGGKQQVMGEARRGAIAVEAAAHAAADWNEAAARAAAGEAAVARDAWEEAADAFDQAAILYRRAEERSRETLRARVDAEKAAEAIGLARRAAAEAEAARHAPEPWGEAEGAETRAHEAFDRGEYAAARSLFAEARRLYATAATRATGVAAEAEARRLDAIVSDARRLLESADVTTCLERLNEVLALRPGHAAAEALRAQTEQALHGIESAAHPVEAPVKSAEKPAEVPKASDEAPTRQAQLTGVGDPPTVIADRHDATVPAGATSGDASGLPSGGLVARETRLRGRSSSAPEVVGKTPARPRRVRARVVAVGVGGLAAILIAFFYWRSQPPPASIPTQQSTPAQPTAAPDARPAEVAGRDEAAQLRSQVIAARDEAARADAERLAATQFTAAEEKSSAAEGALSQRDMATAQARYREAIETYGLAKTEANRVAALARGEAAVRIAEGQAQEAGRAASDSAAAADRARTAARERAPVAPPLPRPTPAPLANRPGVQKPDRVVATTPPPAPPDAGTAGGGRIAGAPPLLPSGPSAAQQPEPLRIRASVEQKLRAARLLRNPDSDEPGVAVEGVGVDGHVELVGVLRDEADRQAAARLARTVEGVTAVDVRRINIQKGWRSQ